MHTAKIIACTEPKITDPETNYPITVDEFVAYVARVSNPENQHNHLTAPKLLRYLAKHKHWSPFELVDVVMEIETTRDIGRQILRHRSFSFQEFCVEENTMIRMKSRCVPIKDLYKRQCNKQYSDMSDWMVRVYDHDTKQLTYAKIKEVFETGVKPVYEVLLDNGKKITCTKDHKLLTFDGYSTVENLTIDKFVACNGVPLYQDKEWLENAKKVSIETGGGVNMIAEMANVKYSTIRKWLKRHGIQFSRKEAASCTLIWNKGLPPERQPMYGKFHDHETRTRQSIMSTNKGKSSNFYKNGKYVTSNLSWRNLVAVKCSGYKSELMIEQKYVCPISGVTLTRENSEVDHVLPVCFRPDLAFEKSNLRVVHKDAHRKKSLKEARESKYTASYSKVVSITYVGDRQTYDMEIDHVDHNYVANGIITHNSQRYADPTQSLGFTHREARLQDLKNRQNSIEISEKDDPFLELDWQKRQATLIEQIEETYKWAIQNGIAKEQARAVLPEGLTVSRMYMKGSLRSWIHYCQLRMDVATQKEHRQIATDAWYEITRVFPSLKDALDIGEK